jgi:hypothetical protein
MGRPLEAQPLVQQPPSLCVHVKLLHGVQEGQAFPAKAAGHHHPPPVDNSQLASLAPLHQAAHRPPASNIVAILSNIQDLGLMADPEVAAVVVPARHQDPGAVGHTRARQIASSCVHARPAAPPLRRPVVQQDVAAHNDLGGCVDAAEKEQAVLAPGQAAVSVHRADAVGQGGTVLPAAVILQMLHAVRPLAAAGHVGRVEQAGGRRRHPAFVHEGVESPGGRVVVFGHVPGHAGGEGGVAAVNAAANQDLVLQGHSHPAHPGTVQAAAAAVVAALLLQGDELHADGGGIGVRTAGLAAAPANQHHHCRHAGQTGRLWTPGLLLLVAMDDEGGGGVAVFTVQVAGGGRLAWTRPPPMEHSGRQGAAFYGWFG